MKTITLQVPNLKTEAFEEIIKKLGFAKKVQILEDDGPTKEEILAGIREGFEEVKLIRAGKLKAVSLKEFLNEL